MRDVLHAHHADIWFLTELHADFELTGYQMAYSAYRDNAPCHQRKTAIASRFPMSVIETRSHPAEGRLCLGRLLDPITGETLIAASTVLPCRSKTPCFSALLGEKLSYAGLCQYMLDYFASRINEERRPGEALVWGGDFNQGFYGRDYVGTLKGRKTLIDAFESFDLRVPTMNQPALIETHPAIDHIAIPGHWTGSDEAQVYRPTQHGKYLSDHALYIVEAEQPVKLQ